MKDLDLWKYLKKTRKTYDEFRRFLFLKLGNNKENFVKFTSYPTDYQLPMLVAFLEYKEVPILTALLYYNYKIENYYSYTYLLKYTIIAEFNRIEKKEIINYIPF